MNTLIRSSVISLLIVFLAACGGGGGGSSTATTTVQSAPTAATAVNMAVSGKSLDFTWTAGTHVDHYRISVNSDGASGFTVDPSATNIVNTATSYSIEVPVHKLNWLAAQYIVEACNTDESNCITSPNQTLALVDSVAATIYAKASNPTASDGFGQSVSVSSDGNTLAVGAYSEDGSIAGINGTQDDLLADAGAVYVFTRSGTTWTQQAYVKASNPTAGDRFGVVSLSSDGNTLAVGAHYEDGSIAGINGADNDSSSAAGAVYVFTRSGMGVWTQQAYVKASNPSAGDQFGQSVSVSSDGNTLAVGAYSEDGSIAGINGTQDDLLADAGAVYVFTRSGTTWTQQAYVKASNPSLNDYFGTSVSVSSDGNTLAVGAQFEDGSIAGIGGTQDDLLADAGAVYVFTRSGTVWTQQAYVKASNPTAGDRFGISVSVSSDGNTLAVGANSEDGSSAGINGADNDSFSGAGAAYVFTRSGTTWTQQAYVKASNPTASDYFGFSVSVSSDGNTLAVGAGSEDGSIAGIGGTQDDLLNGAGAVYVFTRSGTAWTQQAYVKASNPSASDSFGYSVSVSSDGNTLAVGARYEEGSSAGINGADNDSSIAAGAVYIY